MDVTRLGAGQGGMRGREGAGQVMALSSPTSQGYGHAKWWGLARAAAGRPGIPGRGRRSGTCGMRVAELWDEGGAQMRVAELRVARWARQTLEHVRDKGGWSLR